MFHDGLWGTVCDDYWGMDDAKVVCRSLGFGRALRAYDSAFYGQGVGEIILDNVGCTGGESNLLDCSSNALGSHNCEHYEDAGVLCGMGK